VLKVNLRDGRTLTFDLLDPAEMQAWCAHQADPKFQSEITGAGIQHDGTLLALPVPQGFHRKVYEAEVLYRGNGDGRKVAAERLTCYADSIRLSVTAHHGNRPRVVKYAAAKVGRMRYSPAIHGPVKKGDER